ncbi:MAG: hypothetical protein M1818_005380 [Claussenomyces sp. TS43310]|nr:MAG: hypothetical protein M1818_005380 [Claussenomyces sp. TS43310]
MRVLRNVAATVCGALLLVEDSRAYSTQRNPIKYVSIVDEPVIHTPSHRAHAHSSFDLTFHLHQKQQVIKLKLEPNHDVLAEDATVQYLAADGTVREIESIDRSEHRIFKGQTWTQKYEGAEWTNVGWARVMLHHDGERPIFEGAFLAEGDHHHIQTQIHYEQTKHRLDPSVPENAEDYMVVWRDSDIGDIEQRHAELRRDLSDQRSCAADGLHFNMQPDHPVFARMPKREIDSGFWGSVTSSSLFRRQIDGTTVGNSAGVNLVSTIGDSAGCFNTRMIALVGVATDCTYTAELGNSSAVKANVITQINLASVQFENSFNITLGLQNLTISDAACPANASSSAPWNVACSDDITIQDRLNLFSAWRGGRNDTNAYWTLLSTCPTEAAVGLAWLGQACLNKASVSPNETTTSANIVIRTSTEWQAVVSPSSPPVPWEMSVRRLGETASTLLVSKQIRMLSLWVGVSAEMESSSKVRTVIVEARVAVGITPVAIQQPVSSPRSQCVTRAMRLAVPHPANLHQMAPSAAAAQVSAILKRRAVEQALCVPLIQIPQMVGLLLNPQAKQAKDA